MNEGHDEDAELREVEEDESEYLIPGWWLFSMFFDFAPARCVTPEPEDEGHTEPGGAR